MIILIQERKDFFEIEFCDVLNFKNSEIINKIDLNVNIGFPKLFKDCHYSNKIESEYYVKFRCIPDSELKVLNLKSYKTKKYGEIIKEKFNISNYYEIEYCLPKEFLKITFPFKNLKEILEKFKILFSKNSSIFYINLEKLFLYNNIEKTSSEIKFTIKSYSNNADIEKIKEFIKNFINLTNEKLCIEINSENFYDVLIRGNSDNNSNFSLSFNKIDKIFEILNILQGLRKIKIFNSKTLEIDFGNPIYIEIDLDEFLQNFDEYINTAQFINSILFRLILDYANGKNSSEKQKIFRLFTKIMKRFKNEFIQIENLIKLLEL